MHDGTRRLVDVHEVERRARHIALHAERTRERPHKEGLAHPKLSIEADDRALVDDFTDGTR